MEPTKAIRNKRIDRRVGTLVGICLGLGLSFPVHAQTHPPSPNQTQKEKVMATHARGAFEIKMNPQTSYEESVGRMSIDKQFHGNLEATSKGEFLGVYGSVKGSAGYVAMEKVSGTLNGRSGTFVLQHSGTMTQGAQQMTVTVVPDSGTGQLVGLRGSMVIKIESGNHFYEFDYTLPEAP